MADRQELGEEAARHRPRPPRSADSRGCRSSIANAGEHSPRRPIVTGPRHRTRERKAGQQRDGGHFRNVGSRAERRTIPYTLSATNPLHHEAVSAQTLTHVVAALCRSRRAKRSQRATSLWRVRPFAHDPERPSTIASASPRALAFLPDFRIDAARSRVLPRCVPNPSRLPRRRRV
jgi:hypothetical protein